MLTTVVLKMKLGGTMLLSKSEGVHIPPSLLLLSFEAVRRNVDHGRAEDEALWQDIAIEE